VVASDLYSRPLLGAFAARFHDDGGLDPQRRARPGGAGADAGAGGAPHHGGVLATAHPADLLDHADSAGRGVLAIQPGHEQYPGRRIGARIGRELGRLDGRPGLGIGQLQRHHHARQNHGVVQRKHGQGQDFGHVTLAAES
jgi:hypothetical protein